MQSRSRSPDSSHGGVWRAEAISDCWIPRLGMQAIGLHNYVPDGTRSVGGGVVLYNLVQCLYY